MKMKCRLHFVVDPMGWSCVSMVFGIWLYNTVFVPKLILFPHYDQGHVPWLLLVCYYGASLLCLTALVRASTADPGRIPQDPHIPHAERDSWELCNKCNLMRPLRSHHCSRCRHCVRRMDHHCPWINNCVGEDNHWLFLQLCFYTQVLSGFTLLLDFSQYYYLDPLTHTHQESFCVRHELALLRVSTFMGMLMFGGMSSLFYTQLNGILTDTTTVEKMSFFQTPERSPGGRPWQVSLSEVFGTHWKLLWFIPFRIRKPLGGAKYTRIHV